MQNSAEKIKKLKTKFRLLLKIAKKKIFEKNLKYVDFIHGDETCIPIKDFYFDGISA